MRCIALLSGGIEPDAFRPHLPVGAQSLGDLREHRTRLRGATEIALDLGPGDCSADVVAVVLELTRGRLELSNTLLPQPEIEQRKGALGEQIAVLCEVIDEAPFRIIGIADLGDRLVGNRQGGGGVLTTQECAHQQGFDA